MKDRVMNRVWAIRFLEKERNDENFSFFEKEMPGVWTELSYIDKINARYVVSVDDAGNVLGWAQPR